KVVFALEYPLWMRLMKDTANNPAVQRFILAPHLCLIPLFLFFWHFRARRMDGDGELIGRITEGGKWFVKNEMFSQTILQALHQTLAPYLWTPMEIMNLASCLAGTLSVWLLLHYARRFYRLPLFWPLLLFLSSGFLIYSCGRTEYYPLFLPAMIYYGHCALEYLDGEKDMLFVAFVFVLAASLHFAMMIALPSLLLLPLLTQRRRDYRRIVFGLLPLIPLFVIRNYPQIAGFKAASLSPVLNFLPLFYSEDMNRYYSFFQWAHIADWLYAWTMRSWIFWPAVIFGLCQQGMRSLLDKKRFFLFVYTLSFTLWSLVWHPDLGMAKDWDLFAIEAAPCLLLLIAYLPSLLSNPFHRTALAIALAASIAMAASHVFDASLPRRGFGSILVDVDSPGACRLKIDGAIRPYSIPRLVQGVHEAKLIDLSRRRVLDFHIIVSPGIMTKVVIDRTQEPAEFYKEKTH
ncbi:MAG: hypothetical protein AB1656_26490, partial [Candidatus Omnitrophota bacterium]